MKNTINNKAEYLAWRTQWRSDYKSISESIRQIKFCRWFQDSARNGVKMSATQISRNNSIAETHQGPHRFCPSYALEKYRAKATAMLEERKASKLAAQESYLKLLVRNDKVPTTSSLSMPEYPQYTPSKPLALSPTDPD